LLDRRRRCKRGILSGEDFRLGGYQENGAQENNGNKPAGDSGQSQHPAALATRQHHNDANLFGKTNGVKFRLKPLQNKGVFFPRNRLSEANVRRMIGRPRDKKLEPMSESLITIGLIRFII